MVIAAANLLASPPARAVSPQWVVNVESRVRTQERPLADLAGSWVSLSDGSQVLAARRHNDYTPSPPLRRISPDGQVSDFGPYYASAFRVLLATAQDGVRDGFFALSSGPEEHAVSQLQFLQNDGRQRWSINLPSNAADGEGPAVAVSPQADGSALVLRKRSLLKVDANGRVKWHFGNGNANHFMLDQAALAVDSLGVSWVGGRGGLRLGADHLKFAAVRRFDSKGNLLSLGLLLCDSCTQSRVHGLAVLPSGEVAVVGRSGANEPGFFAMYEHYGPQRLRVFTAPGGGYDHVVADAANNVYALARDINTVSAIDPTNGSVRWQKSGSDISTLPEGVLIAQAPASGVGALTLTAYAPDGSAQWSRQIEASDGSALGGARYEDGVTRVVAMIERSGPDCGISPSLVTLDAIGMQQSAIRACTIATRRYWQNASSGSETGIAGNLGQRVVRFSVLGEKLTDYTPCPLCPAYDNPIYTDASQAMPDGSTWVTTTYRGTTAPPAPHKLLRLAAGGNVLSETPLPGTGGGMSTRLLADASQAVVLVPQRGSVHWIRVSAGGSLLGAATFSLPGQHDKVDLLNTRLWPDGSTSLVTQRYNVDGCEADPPPPRCYELYNTVLRINADGSENWRAELDQKWLNASIEDDGSHVVLISAWEAGDPVRLRRIDANGTVSAAVAIADSAEGYVGHGIGPVRGRYLFTTPKGYRLVDRDGNLLASSGGSLEYGLVVAYAAPGFIVASGLFNGRLISADDLSELAQFDIDGADLYPPFDTYWEHWSLSDDGSVYMSEQPSPRNGNRPRLARFAVPGSAADDVIFIDRF